MIGLAVGIAAGLTAGLLAAPMRGSDMRANLRDRVGDGSVRLQSLASSGREWARQALDRGLMLWDEGRRAFDTPKASRALQPAEPMTLTATLGEIAQTHGSVPAHMPASMEGRS